MMEAIDKVSDCWKEWNRQHKAIREWIEMRNWKLFLTLVDKKTHPEISGWKSRFRSLGAQGYTEREGVVRCLMNSLRSNLGIRRTTQFYWLGKHEFGAHQDDPHVHVLIDYSPRMTPDTLQRALQPIRDGSWLKQEGFDLCFRLKNDPELPILIDDLEKARNYFAKDESDDTRADQNIWLRPPPKVDGALAFMNSSFTKQIKCHAK